MSALAATAKPTTIVWLRDELRVHDNALLAEAAARGGPVLPVYVLDDRVFDAAATSESGGSRNGLVVERGRPADVLAGLCAAVGGDATVLCSDAACSEERKDEAAAAKVAPLAKVWEGTLYHPEDLRGVAFHDLFTAWRTKVEKAGTRASRRRLRKPRRCRAPPGRRRREARGAAPHARRPRLRRGRRGLRRPRRLLRARGRRDRGARAPRKYAFEEDRLKDYYDTRNGMIGQGYSTKLAPWLSRGCVSPRAVARACAYERTRGIKNKRLGRVEIDRWFEILELGGPRGAGAGDYPAPLPTQGFKFPDGARPGKKSHQQDRKGKGGERAQIQRKRKQKSPAGRLGLGRVGALFK
ncbi:DNA photolyase [Aureococcus anophagefferens]|uniref:DNA photolyase n=1 Tax=Aureococcus anophagefferens TaxID=44056 RepID=A0ABR1G0E9_AURAN